MVIDDVVINKLTAIQRCLSRVEEEYAADPANLFTNITKQDSIVLNLQRACELSIDLAMYAVKLKGLGMPQSSRDSFDLLKNAGMLPGDLAESMKKMVGFRNVAIHEYQRLDLEIVKRIVERDSSAFLSFVELMKKI